ncbi:MAG: hypothetical protein N2Z23_00060 [Pyrinomonadaceae bacterium]|nr:hypothetical protein [Pyrinomonadaceae bacterium]MCX7638827.1 hypothetical protein [Pyrinomonadaceae bacterium]MDW8305037.1 hypothetical protein [Acidobacteriota bacterium]
MNCAYHMENEAIVNCNGCGKPLCRACDHRIKGFPFCQDCIVTGIELLQKHRSVNSIISKRAPSPFVACLLSLICPGLGSVYNKQALKALIYFSVFASLFQLAIITSFPVFAFGFLGTWVFSAVDAWQTAKTIRLGMQTEGFGDWLVRYFQDNPKVWGVLLLILGATLLSHLIFPFRFFEKLVFPIILIVLGIYVLQNHLQKKELGKNYTSYPKTSFRTGEFELKKFDNK